MMASRMTDMRSRVTARLASLEKSVNCGMPINRSAESTVKVSKISIRVNPRIPDMNAVYPICKGVPQSNG